MSLLDISLDSEYLFQISTGMNYLHTLKTPIVHRDLKIKNILVDDACRMKVITLIKVKGVCLKSRYPRYTCSSDFTFPLAVGAYSSRQLSIQPCICAPGTHTAWWTEAVWNTKFARHFYTLPTLGIEPQTFWSWVQRPIHLDTCSHMFILISRSK